jgi:hypothetical protein
MRWRVRFGGFVPDPGDRSFGLPSISHSDIREWSASRMTSVGFVLESKPVYDAAASRGSSASTRAR